MSGISSDTSTSPARPSHPRRSDVPARCPVRASAPAALYAPDLDGDRLGAFYERLRRQHGPVAPVALAPGLSAWLVIGYRELLQVCHHDGDFSHDSRLWNLLREGAVPEDSPVLAMVSWRPAAAFLDGTEHRRIRTAVSDVFGLVDTDALTHVARCTAEELIDDLSTRQEPDLVPHYAHRLSTRVLCGLLGLTERTGQQVMEAAASLTAAHADSANASRRLDAALRRPIEEKYRTPGPDLISWLILHPAQLSASEVLHNVSLVTTAHQYTKNWIGAALRLLLTDRAFRNALSSGDLTLDEALDRVLWRYPPIQHVPGRVATRDLRLGNKDIRAGDLLVLGLAGANADPEEFPEGGFPAAGNRAHIAFGVGPHACPAAHLARVVTRTAVGALHDRLPGVELAVPESELAWARSPWAKGLATLPVRIGRG